MRIFLETPPKALYDILNELLPELEFVASITNLSLPISQGESTELIADFDGVRVSEDDLEVALCDEDQVIQDIENMGCTTFLESEVITRSRVSTSRFMVFVESKTCMERKAPFPTAGGSDINSFQEFFNDLKLLNSLRGCRNVTRFIGVVLDNTRKHTKSYLHEYPNYNIRQIFDTAASRSITVPWKIRETWARQIITAISEIHGKGAVAGVGPLWLMSVRANGSAEMGTAITSKRFFLKKKLYGYQAPELRDSDIVIEKKALPKTLNFRTDILTLGLILWQLAEHRAHFYGGNLCSRHGCTNFPHYACKAPHVDPIELPECSAAEIPEYFRKMIRKCRSLDPKARPSAHQLLESFPDEIKNGNRSMSLGIEEISKEFQPIYTGATTNCEECGSLTTEDYYHCGSCLDGDLDFCPACVEQGIHCFVPEHRLIRKRVSRN